MLAKHMIKKYGYKWDDNWQDTENIISVLKLMESLEENLNQVVIDIASYVKQRMMYTTYCPYCGEESDSSDEKVLCRECRETFGHTTIDEL
jgi:NADH pyrophosphatase NudC (nudix superfamily)